MNQTLTNLLLALVTNEFLHNFAEITSIRAKVKRLNAYMKGETWKETPININTRAKSYGVSTLVLVIFGGILWGVFSLIGMGGDTALRYGIIVLLLTFAMTAVLADKYHVEIEQITKPFKNKSKK